MELQPGYYVVRYRAHTKPGMGETDNDVIATFGGIEWHTLEIHGRGILDPRCATILAGPFTPEQVVAALAAYNAAGKAQP